VQQTPGIREPLRVRRAKKTSGNAKDLLTSPGQAGSAVHADDVDEEDTDLSSSSLSSSPADGVPSTSAESPRLPYSPMRDAAGVVNVRELSDSVLAAAPPPLQSGVHLSSMAKPDATPTGTASTRREFAGVADDSGAAEARGQAEWGSAQMRLMMVQTGDGHEILVPVTDQRRVRHTHEALADSLQQQQADEDSVAVGGAQHSTNQQPGETAHPSLPTKLHGSRFSRFLSTAYHRLSL